MKMFCMALFSLMSFNVFALDEHEAANVTYQEADVSFSVGAFLNLNAPDNDGGATPPTTLYYSCYAATETTRHILESLGARNVEVTCSPGGINQDNLLALFGQALQDGDTGGSRRCALPSRARRGRG